MPWGRIDDTYYDHPKLELLTGDGEWPDRLAAAGLNALAWSWCNRFLTDGHVPTRTVAKLGGTLELAALLVGVGLWEEAPHGFQIHDFLTYNDSREQVLERRAKEAKRKAEWRLSHRDKNRATGTDDDGPAGTPNGSGPNVPPSVPPSVPLGHSIVSRDSTRANPDPTRPDPTRPTVENDSPSPRKRGRRKDGTNDRAIGASPRATGANPRASGTSSRQEREAEKHGPTALGDVLRRVAQEQGIGLPGYVRPSEPAAETPPWAQPAETKP